VEVKKEKDDADEGAADDKKEEDASTSAPVSGVAGRSKRIKKPVQFPGEEDEEKEKSSKRRKGVDKDGKAEGYNFDGRGGKGKQSMGLGGPLGPKDFKVGLFGKLGKRKDGRIGFLGEDFRPGKHEMHPERMFPRPAIGKVLASTKDQHMAFFACRSIVEIERGGFSAQTRMGVESVRMDRIVKRTLDRVPLPVNAEINMCLDVLESRSDLIWDQLMEIQRVEKRIAEGELDDALDSIRQERAARPAPAILGSGLLATNKPLIAAPSSMLASSSYAPPSTTTASTTTPSSSTGKESAVSTTDANGNFVPSPLVQALMSQNVFRAKEAHIMAAMDKSHVDAAAGNLEPMGSASLAEMDAYESFGESAPPTVIFTATALPTYSLVEKRMASQRVAVMKQIRSRKMAKRRAWEELGDRYLYMQHKWKRYIDEVEGQLMDRDTFRPRRDSAGGASAQSAGGAETPRANDGAANGLGSRASARLSGVSASPFGLSDVAGISSDPLMQQLAYTENLNRRIKKGAAPTVEMNTPWPGPDFKAPAVPVWPEEVCDFEPDEVLESTDATYPKCPEGSSFDLFDVTGSRLTVDGRRQTCSTLPLSIECPPGCNCARQVDYSERRCRPWSDIEKCIFVDKFMQYPKNFSKIAAYLTHRSTGDCIKFYYDSKAVIPFKALLKEADNRRKHIRNLWVQTENSATSLGGVIYPPKDPDDIEPLMELPFDDVTYQTMGSHPPFNAKALQINVYPNPGRPVSNQPRQLTIAQAERRAKATAIVAEGKVRAAALKAAEAERRALANPKSDSKLKKSSIWGKDDDRKPFRSARLERKKLESVAKDGDDDDDDGDGDDDDEDNADGDFRRSMREDRRGGEGGEGGQPGEVGYWSNEKRRGGEPVQTAGEIEQGEDIGVE
jgi:nuclear receptor co-repressor 1